MRRQASQLLERFQVSSSSFDGWSSIKVSTLVPFLSKFSIGNEESMKHFLDDILLQWPLDKKKTVLVLDQA